MTPDRRLRLSLLAALGLGPVLSAACHTKPTGDDTDTDTTIGVDTDVRETGADDTDVTDTDTDTDTDVTDTDTDVTDTDLTDSDVSDTDVTDTDVSCATLPDAAAEWQAQGYYSGTDYQLCRPIPFTDAACATTTTNDLQAALPSDTGTGAGYSVSQTCGPFADASGDCCFDVQIFQWVIGRPFAAGDGFRTAGGTDGGGWASPGGLDAITAAVDAAEAWEAIALGEHASIASFATFVLDLLAHGAPAALVADAIAAMGDEVRHAEGAFALASSLRGSPRGPGSLPTHDARARASLDALLRAVIAEGCVGETIAAHEADVAHGVATAPAVRAHLEAVAGDEARHAALAWRTVRWILEARPDLVDTADEAFAVATAEVRQRPAAGVHLPEVGLLGGPARVLTARRGLDRVVGPTWAALRATVA